MKVSFYGHVRQYHNIKAEIDANIREVLESGSYVMGPMLKRFEKELADYHGMKYAVGVNSGTDALWLAFHALGIGPGDAGATAVFVDSDPQTNCIDPSKIEAAISPKTKALVPVHLYGQCADMKAIREIADKHNLLVIEDNAQGIGSQNLGTFGDGGAVVTNNEEVDRQIRKLRNHGSSKRSVHSPGFNSRLDDLHAGILSAKLKHIDEWNDLRRQWAARYSAALADARTITLPYERPGYRHVYHLYVIETKEAEHRDPLLKFLNDNGIDAKCHYPIAIHQQEGYPWDKEARIAGPIPNSERNAACCISLPMYPELTAEEVDYVAAKVLEWEKSVA